MPACLLSQPNSLMVSPACNMTSFFTMYSLYLRLREALCNHTAPHSNSSCNINILYLKFTMNINLGPLFILNAYLMRYGGCLPGNHSRHSRKGTLQSAGYYCTHPGGCQQSRRPTKKPFHTNTHDTTVNFSILMIYIPKYANV